MKYAQRYRKKDPAKGEEEELVENFFVCTYASLLQGNFHTEFFNVEGLELILIFLRYIIHIFNLYDQINNINDINNNINIIL